MSADTQPHWALLWNERPIEEAAHFNPAFCGELIARAISNYEKTRAAPLPFALAFLILPLSLHPGARRALPKKANTTLSSWAGEHANTLGAVPDRVLHLRPVSREALMFLLHGNAITIGPSGLASGSAPIRLGIKLPATTPETDEIRRAAGLLGRWFAFQGSPAAILQIMGVRI